jgi:hypothetical protein
MTVQLAVPTLINVSVLLTLGPADAVEMKDAVLTALTGHPFFKDIPLDPLAAAGTRLEETVRLTGLGNRSLIPDRTNYLAIVIKELTRVAFYVQLQAFDDDRQLHTTGFPIAERRTRVLKDRPTVKMLTGFGATNIIDEVGAVMLTADSQEAAFGYQFQFTKGDPTVEANWIDEAPAPHRTCKKITVRELDSLSKYSFRGRAVGDDGVGPWSKVVTISVT